MFCGIASGHTRQSHEDLKDFGFSFTLIQRSLKDWPGDLCVLPDDEDNQRIAPVVIHELNYLPHDPDFKPQSGGPQTAEKPTRR